MDDSFLFALERLADAKAKMMQTMTEELATAHDSSAIVDVLHRAGERFVHFSETAEIPFEQQFGDRITAALPQGQFLAEKHHLAIAAFLSALQRLKFDEPFVGDSQSRLRLRSLSKQRHTYQRGRLAEKAL